MTSEEAFETRPRLAAFAKDAAEEALFSALNRALLEADLPRPEAGSADLENLPIVYTVGAPRSGTTLLSQVICRYLPVGYITNLTARFWLRPSVGIGLARAVLGKNAREEITFRSTHGVSEGPAGPHEFGYFWRHWLALDGQPTHHLSAEALGRVDAAGLKGVLEAEILASFGSPVALKNIICGFHADFLTRLHPASVFVYIDRDLFATAASILASRRQRYGSYDAWWSLKPSTHPFSPPPADAVEEVVRQVRDCRREMQRELARPGVKVIALSYEGLCADPGKSGNGYPAGDGRSAATFQLARTDVAGRAGKEASRNFGPVSCSLGTSDTDRTTAESGLEAGF